MNNSLKLFAVRGIDVRLHFTFPLILIWAALQFGLLTGNVSGAVFGVVAISLLFALVTLHELGHSFAALHYGVPVKQIVLSPIGGVAQMTRMPDKPVEELVISIAGPAVNVFFALLMGAMALGLGIDLSNPLGVLSGTAGLSLAALFSYVFFSNIFLAAFNLIPAFPMDGGRVLRALLAMRLDYARATDIAALIGRGFAILLGLFGLFNGSIFQIFIAIFIFAAASQEAAYVRARHALRGYSVQQVSSETAYRLEPNFTLQQAANLMLYSGQQNFPVVYGERVIGMVSRADLRNALRTRPAYDPVTTIMKRDVQPVTPQTDLFDVQARMMDEEVEALPVVNEEGRFAGVVTREQLMELHRLVREAPHAIPRTQSV